VKLTLLSILVCERQGKEVTGSQVVSLLVSMPLLIEHVKAKLLSFGQGYYASMLGFVD